MPTVEPVQTKECPTCGAQVVNLSSHNQQEHQNPAGPGPVG
jgi:endogenous inhibitor of DNA gyrase (YacG/DUF329 family)